MKKIRPAFAAVLAISAIILSGCSKESMTTDETSVMYSKMLAYADSYSSIINEQLTTKSTYSSLNEQDLPIDLSCVDEKYLKYIDIYTQPDNINDWDEQALFEQINNDKSLSSEDKEILVKSIAGAYYLKTEFSEAIKDTKADAEQCEREFLKAMKRATRNFTLALAVALLEPTPAGETCAVIYYYWEINDAQEDYNECMANCTDN